MIDSRPEAGPGPATESLLKPRPTAGARRLVYISFVFPALAGMLFGYDIGTTSGALLNVACTLSHEQPTGGGCDYFDGRAALYGVLTSASLSGAFIGTLVVFWVGGVLGRRRELIGGALLYLLGTAITVLAPGGSLSTIGLGRFTYGLGVAFSMHAAPVYIAEIAPASVRGLLVSAKEAFIVGGILLGFGAVAVANDAALGLGANAWRAVWALPAPFAIAVALGMLFIAPPSPRWLVVRAVGRAGADADVGEARAALRRLRAGAADAAIEAELAEVVGTLSGEEESASSWALLCRTPRALVAGVGLVLLQQMTGQPSVLYYTNQIFKWAGLGAATDVAAVIVGVAKLGATLVTVARVDRFEIATGIHASCPHPPAQARDAIARSLRAGMAVARCSSSASR